MEGGDNSKHLPADLWTSQIDSQYTGSRADSSNGNSRSLNPQMDMSRKHQLYNNYDLGAMNYNSPAEAKTSASMNLFAQTPSRSAWEFAAKSFPTSSHDFTSHSIHGFAAQNLCETRRQYLPQNMSQPYQNRPNEDRVHSLGNSNNNPASSSQTPVATVPSGQSDRSVWSHLYSLDPSLESYDRQRQVIHNTNVAPNKVTPLSHLHTDFAGNLNNRGTIPSTSSILPAKPPLIHSLNAHTFSTSNLNQASSRNENVVSSYSSPMYSSVSANRTPAQIHHAVGYEEPPRGYSPVSPPMHDLPSSSTSNIVNDCVVSSSEINLPLDTSFMPPENYVLSTMSQPANDMPLDMTTSWSSKCVDKTSNSAPTDISSNISDSLPYTAQLSTSFQPVTEEGSFPARSMPSTLNQCANNLPQKIAPKKSNFYGRDASFFSLHESSPPLLNISENSTSNVEPKKATGDTIFNKQSNARSPPVQSDPSQVESNLDEIDECPLSLDSATSANVNFGDSFIEATTSETLSKDKSDENIQSENSPKEVDLKNEDNSLDRNIQRSIDSVTEVKSENESDDKTVAEEISESSSLDQQNLEGAEKEMNVQFHQKDLSEENPNVFETVNMLSNKYAKSSKAQRGRKKRGGGVQRRGGRKSIGKQSVIVETNKEISNLSTNVGDDSTEINAGNEKNEDMIAKPLPKTRATRGKKRKIDADLDNSDAEVSVGRRSSSRRSKDNAMRLIGLQAESIFSPLSNSIDEPPPSRLQRKASKTAPKPGPLAATNSMEQDIDDEKDSSSDEVTDEKDTDYAVDEDDVDAFEKDKLLDLKAPDKKVQEKRLGGLKISIKLGSDPCAEILTSKPSKKKKVLKKKHVQSKFKSRAVILDDDDIEEENDLNDTAKSVDVDLKIPKDDEKHSPESKKKCEEIAMTNDSKNIAEDVNEKDEHVGGNKVIADKHNSLMDKYFSSAKSQAFQTKKSKNIEKKDKLHKPDKVIKSKNVTSLKGNSLKNSSKASSNANSDTEVPKFVCGYCPNRYHTKQSLMSHMEAHMAEMEEKPKKSSDTSHLMETEKTETAQASVKESLNLNKKGKSFEETKFTCGECGKSFPSKLDLLDHVRAHAAEKPFECNLCHKFFKERDQLSIHRKIHAQEGLQRCPVCSKGFVNNADLDSHMESHPKRSKSGLGTKGFLSNSLKKSENVSTDNLKKVNKTTISHEKESNVVKLKSFASALDPTLKSKDTLLSSKPNTISVKHNKTSTSLKAVGDESSNKVSSVKGGQTVKDLKNIKPVDENKQKMNDNKVDESTGLNKDDSNSQFCTCQECPECVTRFLQSFD